MPKANPASKGGTAKTWPAINAATAPATAEKIPPSRTTGRLSVTCPQRIATVKAANPAAEINAATVPSTCPPPIWPMPPTITKIPTKANKMAPHVGKDTGSFSKTRPNTAAKKGEAEKSSIALATVVDCSATMAPPKANTSPSPPTTPAQPTCRNAGRTLPGPIQSINTGTMPEDRQNSTAQLPASSNWRIRTPWIDQTTPANIISPAPVRYRMAETAPWCIRLGKG